MVRALPSSLGCTAGIGDYVGDYHQGLGYTASFLSLYLDKDNLLRLLGHCRQPAPARAILSITSAHTALRVASGLIGSRNPLQHTDRLWICAFVAVTAAYAAVHLWETDKFIPGYWRGAPDAFVRDAMVPPHRIAPLVLSVTAAGAVRPPARRVSEYSLVAPVVSCA